MILAIDIRALLTDRDSGVTVYTRELLRALFLEFPEQNFILYFNTFDKKIRRKLSAEFSNISNVQVVNSSYPNKLLNPILSFFHYPKLDRIVSKKSGQKIDTFLIPDPRPSPLSKNCQKITTFHDLSFEHYSNTFSLKTRLWHRFILKPKKEALESDQIIAVSNATKKDLVETYGVEEGRIQVVYSGVSESFGRITNHELRITVQQKYQLPEKFFLSLSTLEPRKNLQRLIDAFVEWKKRTQHPHTLVIAGIEDATIFNNKRPLAIPEEFKKEVQLVGYIDPADKPGLYSLADVLYFVSLYEGFGLPIIEAMACGTPVVTSNRSSMPEIAGDSALLVDPENQAELRSSFDTILQEGELYARKGEGRVQQFHWDKCAKETMSVFSHVLTFSQ